MGTENHDSVMIEARGLTKRFKALTAVDGVDFEVRAGETFGFLGPNGAGKTSTMRMIGCVSPVTSGSLRVFGMDPAVDGPVIRARMGSVPQADTLDAELTVRENLVIYGRYFDLSWDEARRRADELLQFVQLSDRAGDQVEPLSGGMKRRLTIARALVNEPDLLLLDEPTTGLDPHSKRDVQRLIEVLRDERDVTIVLCTHDLAEAEALCDRIVILEGGAVVADAPPAELCTSGQSLEEVFLRMTGRSIGDDTEERS